MRLVSRKREAMASFRRVGLHRHSWRLLCFGYMDGDGTVVDVAGGENELMLLRVDLEGLNSLMGLCSSVVEEAVQRKALVLGMASGLGCCVCVSFVLGGSLLGH